IVATILTERGPQPGLVHIFSAIETCTKYSPWHDKPSGKTGLKFSSGKCLHYYFYLIDPELGLACVRVPTWTPYRLQDYFNGHHGLASRLKQAQLSYRLDDTVFVEISDWTRAQQISDEVSVQGLHQKLASFARRFCPPSSRFPQGYHWSVMQVIWIKPTSRNDARFPMFQITPNALQTTPGPRYSTREVFSALYVLRRVSEHDRWADSTDRKP
ncbi:MAG TPA: hypothetical protein VGA56_10280, partial [Opitutaceae bacterium]